MGSVVPVLIIDDNVDICECLSFIISEMGYQTHVFTEPVNVLSFIIDQNIQPRFMITDYNLPVMTGHELHQLIHTHFPDIKTIIMSGRSVQNRIGDLPFLQKPFSSTQIINLLETLKAS